MMLSRQLIKELRKNQASYCFKLLWNNLFILKKILTGQEKDKSPIHSMTLGSLASKEFDTTDPELAKHLSNANYIASQIGAGLKVILPHQVDPEYEKRKKRYLKG